MHFRLCDYETFCYVIPVLSEHFSCAKVRLPACQKYSESMNTNSVQCSAFGAVNFKYCISKLQRPTCDKTYSGPNNFINTIFFPINDFGFFKTLSVPFYLWFIIRSYCSDAANGMSDTSQTVKTATT